MRILAIESSAVTASVAILTDDVLTAEYTVNYKKTHSQTLLPMIDEICKMTETEPESFDLIAVSQGPGSLESAFKTVPRIFPASRINSISLLDFTETDIASLLS